MARTPDALLARLNAQGGIADDCGKFGPVHHDLARDRADPRPRSPALIARVEALDGRKSWRDRVQAASMGAGGAILQENA